MKKLSTVTKISCVLFLIVSLLVFALTRPLYKQLEHLVDKYTQQVSTKVTDYTGLYLSYESISPSIFSYFGIKGLKFTDKEKETVLSVKNTHLTYKLSSLLKKDFSNFITGVTVDGVLIDISKTLELIEKFSKPDKEESSDFEPEIILNYVPPNVTVKNVSVIYANSSLQTSLLVKEIKVLNSLRKDTIEFDVKSHGNLKVKDYEIQGDISFDGLVSKNLKDTAVNIRLSDFTDGQYKLNKLNFIASLSDKKIDIRTIQNVIPFNVNLNYDFENNTIAAGVQSQNLSPLSIFSKTANNSQLDFLRNITLTANANASYDLKNNAIAYSATGNCNLNEKLFPSGANIDFKFNGNDKRITVSYLTVKGPSVDAETDFSLIFKTLQLNGTAEVNEFVLPNGKSISTEIYFDQLDKTGFMMFSPQIFIGDRALTALEARIMPQNDSVDFDVEVYDYSHIADDNQGYLKVDGSYLSDSKYVQTSVSANSIYVETILGLIHEIADKEAAKTLQSIADSVQNYMFSGDGYLSTDLKSLSYSVPYLVLANTKADNQLILLSANGNEASHQINQFDMIYGPVSLNATATYDSVPGADDKFFSVDLVSANIPYHISGYIMPGSVSLNGDYGLNAMLHFGENDSFNGYINFESLPFILQKLTYITSLESNLTYTKEDGAQLAINRFQLEQQNPEVNINPNFICSGNATKYGVQLQSITFTDLYSSLTGTADFVLDLGNKNLNSAGININVKDYASEESIIVEANVSNLDNVQLNMQNIASSLYINAMVETSHFNMNRFLAIKNSNNELSASLYLSGTLEHPWSTATIHNFSFLMNNEIVHTNGTIFLEDRDLTINDFQFRSSGFDVKEVSGSISLIEQSGAIKALITGSNDSMRIPLNIDISNIYFSDENKLESIGVMVSSPGISGKLLKESVPFDFTVLYTPEFISFFSSENIGLYGSYNNSEGLYAKLSKENVYSTEITGSFTKDSNFVKLSNINVDLSRLIQNLDLTNTIAIHHGILKGSLSIKNVVDNPDFNGALSITSPSVTIPFLNQENISTEKILITAVNNEIRIADTTFAVKNTNRFKLGLLLSFNKWSIDQFNINLNTLKNQYIPLNMKMNGFNLKTNLEGDVKLAIEDNNLDLTGSLFVENLDVSTALNDIARAADDESKEDKESNMNFRTDLKLRIGTHAVLNFDPLLRCVFVPNTVVDCKIDTASQLYQLDGSLMLKSGDIAYLNRSFYIKSGQIKFNPSEIANPIVTLQAETREKDSEGQTVRIILSADNQYLLDFNPKFSSIPSKSENEIRNLLGQIVIADSESVSELVFSAGDYYLQSTLIRNIENKLRDLMNFDIFSVRTNILKNTISMNNSKNRYKEVSLGNFLDNSTVYIGKYIGSALYVDAMLNMTAAEKTDAEYLSTNGILFQPEFGLELEFPIINIRWDMSWDLSTNMHLKSYVPSTSVSLSWKFTF